MKPEGWYPDSWRGVFSTVVRTWWAGSCWRAGWQHVAVVDGVLVDSCGVVHRGDGPKRCRMEPSLRRAVREVLIHREPLPGL